LLLERLFLQMNTLFTVGLNNGVMSIKQWIIQRVNRRVTKMAMDFAKYIPTRWKVFGRYYVLGSDLIVVFHKICAVISELFWVCS
jgi:hypothetical protein